MTTKILLAKNGANGNLKEYTQQYLMYFLPRVIENGKPIYTDKSSIEFVSVSSNGEAVVKSYRMEDPSQVRLFIFDTVKLWCFHKRAVEELNEFTLRAFVNDLMKQSLQIGKDVQEGVYDSGMKI